MVTYKELRERRPRPGKMVAGRYSLLEHLGRGAFGSVWKAHDTQNDEEVALKLLTAVAFDHSLDQFKSEFELLTKLEHPHINKVYDFGRDSTFGHYFTSTLVRGVSIVRLSKTLDIENIERLYAQALRGLAYLHSQGVHHFDIKPDNVLVETRTDGSYAVKIIDFGFAHMSPLSELQGTPSYMAPELFFEGCADGRADLYALGIILYRCLAREKPYVAVTMDDAKAVHAGPLPPAPSTHNPKLPPYLDAIVARLMARAPTDRYANASHALRDLHSLSPYKHQVEDQVTATSYLPKGELQIGRSEVAAQARSWLREALEQQDPMICTIQGDVGMGKTSFLRALKFDAQLQGFDVYALWGEGATGVDAFIEKIALVLAGTHEQPLALFIDDLDKLLESSSSETLIKLLENLWAAQRQTIKNPLVIYCTSGEIAERWCSVNHVKLLPFSIDDTAAYIDAVAPVPSQQRSRIASALQKRSAGSPAIIKYLMHELIARGKFVDVGGVWEVDQFEDVSIDVEGIPLPEVLYRSVVAIVDAISVVHCETIEHLALWGQATLEDLCAVLQDVEVSAIMYQLVAEGWVSHNLECDTYEIADPFIAEVLIDRLDGSTKQSWHTAIATHLEAVNADESLIDEHLAYGSDCSEAHRALVRVCERERVSKQVERAMRRVHDRLAAQDDVQSSVVQMQELRLLLAGMQMQTNQLNASAATLEEYLSQCDEKAGPEASLKAYEQLGSIALRQRAFERAQQHYERGAQQCADSKHWPLIFRNGMAQVSMLMGKLESAAIEFRSTRELATTLPREMQERITNNRLGECLLMQGHYEEAEKVLAEDLDRLAGSQASSQIVALRTAYASVFARLHKVAEAAQQYELGIAEAQQAQDFQQLLSLYAGRGGLEAEQGNTKEAIPWYKRALPLCYRIGDWFRAVSIGYNLGLFYNFTENPDFAEAQLRTTLMVVEGNRLNDHDRDNFRCPIYHVLGHLAKQRQDWCVATDMLDAAWKLASQYEHLAEHRFIIQVTRAEVARDQGRPKDAIRLLEEAKKYPHTDQEEQAYQEVLRSMQ